MNETIADLIGYPIAGVVVAALSGILGAAFVLDSATYIVSAFLLFAIPQDRAFSPRSRYQ